MRWKGDPVRGTWVAVAPCERCGRYLVDHHFMASRYRQQWGKIAANAPREDFSVWRRFVCGACGKELRAQERQRKREERIRNCVVCGDPFELYSKLRQSHTQNLTCANRKCRHTAEAVFNQEPFRGIYPSRARDLANNALYHGHIHFAQIQYAICALLFFSRGKDVNKNNRGPSRDAVRDVGRRKGGARRYGNSKDRGVAGVGNCEDGRA